MSHDNRSPVTVIGLGAMGTALAGAFLNNGHPTTVWNRSPGKAGALTARGATAAATVAEAIAATPIAVVCLLDYDAVHQVLDPVGTTLAGRTLVNLSNGTPKQARGTAHWAAGHGADYLDGGIMAVPAIIGRPEASVLYSGSREGFRSYEPILGELGAATYLGTDAGRASLYDLALLGAMYGMFGGFFHAAAMIGSDQALAAEFTPLVVSWLNAMAAGLPRMAEAVDSGDHSAADSTVQMQASGYVNLLNASRDQGVSTELVEPMQSLLNRGVAAGLGGGGISSLIALLHADPG